MANSTWNRKNDVKHSKESKTQLAGRQVSKLIGLATFSTMLRTNTWRTSLSLIGTMRSMACLRYEPRSDTHRQQPKMCLRKSISYSGPKRPCHHVKQKRGRKKERKRRKHLRLMKMGEAGRSLRANDLTVVRSCHDYLNFSAKLKL